MTQVRVAWRPLRSVKRGEFKVGWTGTSSKIPLRQEEPPGPHPLYRAQSRTWNVMVKEVSDDRGSGGNTIWNVLPGEMQAQFGEAIRPVVVTMASLSSRARSVRLL